MQAPIRVKIVVVSSGLPSVGTGVSRGRDDPGVYGTTRACPSLRLPRCAALFSVSDEHRCRNRPRPAVLQDARGRVLKRACLRRHVPLRRPLLGRRHAQWVSPPPPGVIQFLAPSLPPRYTAGQTFLYPFFSAAAHAEDAQKLTHELVGVLASPIDLEAVLHISASTGLPMAAIHGNFFTRGRV
jgi:hypothetical protein